MNRTLLLILLIVIGVLILYFIYRKNFKILKTPSVCEVTGAPKTGKSLVCVYLSLKDYRNQHRKWWFHKYILLKKDLEEPLYYTNVFVTFGSSKHKHYVNDLQHFKYKEILKFDDVKKKYFYYHKLDRNLRLITKQSLLRNERFNYRSVIYICETSLVADNMLINDEQRNIELSLFCKLIAHETKGGKLYVDTQNALDTHYAFKRVCSNFYFLQKNINLLLFHIVYVREMIAKDLGENNFTDDIDTTTRKLLIPFWYHNKYDRYEYSYLTDELQKSNEFLQYKKGLVSFNDKYILYGDKRKGVNYEEEKKVC